MDASFRRREDRTELPQSIQFGLKGGLSLRNALASARAPMEMQITSCFRVKHKRQPQNLSAGCLILKPAYLLLKA
jgi:hypothetical protein